jgi:hypothetical protein
VSLKRIIGEGIETQLWHDESEENGRSSKYFKKIYV